MIASGSFRQASIPVDEIKRQEFADLEFDFCALKCKPSNPALDGYCAGQLCLDCLLGHSCCRLDGLLVSLSMLSLLSSLSVGRLLGYLIAFQVRLSQA